MWLKLIFFSVSVRKVETVSIAQNLKFDWLIQVTWKRRIIIRKHKYSLVQRHQSWKIRHCYLFLSLWKQVVYFHETNHCNILSYLQPFKFFKIGVNKNFVKFIGKHLCWSLCFLKRDSDTGTVFWILRNLRTSFLKNTSGLLLLYLWNIFLQYKKT